MKCYLWVLWRIFKKDPLLWVSELIMLHTTRPSVMTPSITHWLALLCLLSSSDVTHPMTWWCRQPLQLLLVLLQPGNYDVWHFSRRFCWLKYYDERLPILVKESIIVSIRELLVPKGLFINSELKQTLLTWHKKEVLRYWSHWYAENTFM